MFGSGAQGSCGNWQKYSGYDDGADMCEDGIPGEIYIRIVRDVDQRKEIIGEANRI